MWYEKLGFLAAAIVLLGGNLLPAQSRYETIIDIL